MIALLRLIATAAFIAVVMWLLLSFFLITLAQYADQVSR